VACVEHAKAVGDIDVFEHAVLVHRITATIAHSTREEESEISRLLVVHVALVALTGLVSILGTIQKCL